MSTGRHGKITVDEARKLAKEVMGHVTKGENPAEDRIVRHGESTDWREPGKKGRKAGIRCVQYQRQLCAVCDLCKVWPQLALIGRERPNADPHNSQGQRPLRLRFHKILLCF